MMSPQSRTVVNPAFSVAIRIHDCVERVVGRRFLVARQFVAGTRFFGEMDVHVHQPRQYCGVAQVDDLILCASVAKAGFDRRDAIALHHDRHVAGRAAADAVDEVTGLDECRSRSGKARKHASSSGAARPLRCITLISAAALSGGSLVLDSTSSTSNTSVAPGGITPPAPASPYASAGGIVRRRLPPAFMPWTPWSHPLITWPAPSRKRNGSITIQRAVELLALMVRRGSLVQPARVLHDRRGSGRDRSAVPGARSTFCSSVGAGTATAGAAGLVAVLIVAGGAQQYQERPREPRLEHFHGTPSSSLGEITSNPSWRNRAQRS